MKFKLVEDWDKLEEDLLIEEQQFYKVLNVPQFDAIYFNYSDEISEPSLKVLKDIISNEKYAGDKINRDLADILADMDITADDIIHVDNYDEIKNIHPSQMLTPFNALWRKEARNNPQVKEVIQKLKNTPYFIHHIDSREHNNELENLMLVLLDQKDKSLENFLHKCLHMIAKSSKDITNPNNSKSFPIICFDASTGNPYKKYLTLQLKNITDNRIK